MRGVRPLSSVVGKLDTIRSWRKRFGHRYFLDLTCWKQTLCQCRVLVGSSGIKVVGHLIGIVGKVLDVTLFESLVVLCSEEFVVLVVD